MEVQLFIPCFIDQLFPGVGFRVVKLLEKAGCSIIYNPNQTCCGQPAFNAGYWDESREVCKKFLKDFSGNNYIVAPSASCVGFIRNYLPQQLEKSAYRTEIASLNDRVYELSEFLLEVLKIDDFDATFHGKVTYHDSCAALRECKIKNGPRKLLSKVKGLELIEMDDLETCCGFGGSFAVKYEAISTAMADQKINNALATGAEYMVSTDMSCLMHIEGCLRYKKKKNLKVLHLADVLTSGW